MSRTQCVEGARSVGTVTSGLLFDVETLSWGKNLPRRKVSMEMCPASWVMSWSIEDSTLILIFLRKLDKIMCFWEKSYYEVSQPCSEKCQHPRVQRKFKNQHPKWRPRWLAVLISEAAWTVRSGRLPLGTPGMWGICTHKRSVAAGPPDS